MCLLCLVTAGVGVAVCDLFPHGPNSTKGCIDYLINPVLRPGGGGDPVVFTCLITPSFITRLAGRANDLSTI